VDLLLACHGVHRRAPPLNRSLLCRAARRDRPRYATRSGVRASIRPAPVSHPVASAPPTLLLSRSVIAGLATTQDYLAAMHDAFTGLAEQSYQLPDAGYVPATGGGFHVKSASRRGPGAVAVIKVNGNFPGNGVAWGLPTIQGFIAVLDAERGCVLALMDSAEITARRTAATSALAARHLARRESRSIGDDRVRSAGPVSPGRAARRGDDRPGPIPRST